ncbi:MAG: PIN domain-containing protein [Nitrososphaerales archaeon]
MCADIVRDGFEGDAQYYLSNQVLSELFVVLTKHVGKPLSKERAATVVSGFADSSKWKKLNYTHLTVKMALQDLQTVSTSFWDILIAETMREAGVKVVYTENERDFRKIPWIQVKNPLLI